MNIRHTSAILILGLVSAACWSSPKADNDEPAANYRSTANTDRNSNAKANSSPAANTNMKDKPATGFTANLPQGFEQPADAIGKKLLNEYGSVFVARGGAVPPKKVVFRDESEVSAFQSSLSTSSETIGAHRLELQAAAMKALENAMSEAKAKGLSISPRGADSAKRTYGETVSLWNSRVDPALKHWVAQGKMTSDDAARIRSLSTFEQVTEVLKLEEQGIYFAKDLSKSIIYSVAPPGTSQHLSMLAFDCAEFDKPEVRSILAANGWYRTVASDLPHFTFLGVKESELPGIGLKKVENGGTFWVPDI